MIKEIDKHFRDNIIPDHALNIDCIDGVDIPVEKVIKWIQTGIDHILTGNSYYYTLSGNTAIICAYNKYQSCIDVYVTQNAIRMRVSG